MLSTAWGTLMGVLLMDNKRQIKKIFNEGSSQEAYRLLAAANPREAKRIRHVYGQGPTFLVTLNRTETFFGTYCSPGGTCSCRQGPACCQHIPLLLEAALQLPLNLLVPAYLARKSLGRPHLAKQTQHFILQNHWIPFL